jgi:hypothetical protein
MPDLTLFSHEHFGHFISHFFRKDTNRYLISNTRGRRRVMNIDGVILTPEALQRLRLLQEEDNDLLKSHTKNLFNVVKFIVRDSDYFSGNKEKMKETLRMADSLFYLCEYLEDLFAKEEKV